jgi:hypothetical protein
LPPCTCVLTPTMVHLYQTSSLLPGLLPIVASASLRLLYSLLYREHINHTQVLGFLPLPYSSHVVSPLSVWPMSNNITAFILGLSSTCERQNTQFLALWTWLTLLKMMFSSSIHLFENDKISFFFIAK